MHFSLPLTVLGIVGIVIFGMQTWFPQTEERRSYMKHYLTIPLMILGSVGAAMFAMQAWFPQAVMLLRFGLPF